jgi:hypothetical protein
MYLITLNVTTNTSNQGIKDNMNHFAHRLISNAWIEVDINTWQISRMLNDPSGFLKDENIRYVRMQAIQEIPTCHVVYSLYDKFQPVILRDFLAVNIRAALKKTYLMEDDEFTVHIIYAHFNILEHKSLTFNDKLWTQHDVVKITDIAQEEKK